MIGDVFIWAALLTAAYHIGKHRTAIHVALHEAGLRCDEHLSIYGMMQDLNNRIKELEKANEQ